MDAAPLVLLAGGFGLGVFIIVAHWLLTHLIVLVLLAVGGAIAGGVGLKERARRQQEQRAWAYQQAQIKAARAAEIATYDAMNDREFEHAIAYLYERDGCTNAQRTGGAGDLGKDVTAVTPDRRLIVSQCKRYALSHKVGSAEVQRFGGTCFAVHRADIAVLITTSTFTKPARECARQLGIRLYDRSDLAGWASGTGPAPWH